jgi:hypothetical protein
VRAREPIGRGQNSVARGQTRLFPVSQGSATFFHSQHTLICQRNVAAHQKMSPHEKGSCETIHGNKYVSTYKSLPYKNASIRKQNKTEQNTCLIKLSMMNLCVIRIVITKGKMLLFSNYSVQLHCTTICYKNSRHA